MFRYWAELNIANTFSTFEDVANQPLWLNQDIKKHKKLIYSDLLISKNVVYISDSLKGELRLFTLDQFNNKFALQMDGIHLEKLYCHLNGEGSLTLTLQKNSEKVRTHFLSQSQ